MRRLWAAIRNSDEGMSTAEYAVGTVAACGFGALLYKILTSGLLGEQYIGVEAGADEKNLAPGDTISATQSAVVLENLIGQFLYNKAAEGKSSAPPAPAPKK